MASGIANNGTASAATSLINSYAGAPAQSVSADTISNNMSPYMNQYVMQALLVRDVLGAGADRDIERGIIGIADHALALDELIEGIVGLLDAGARVAERSRSRRLAFVAALVLAFAMSICCICGVRHSEVAMVSQCLSDESLRKA